jgi:hypothetical protein
MKNSPRKFAIENNLPTYTSRPCKRDHLSERRTSDSACIQCEKERKLSGYYEKFKTDDAAFRKQFTDLRGRAKSKGIPFSIKLEDIERPNFCPVLGVKLQYGINHNTPESKWKKHPNRASFDKLVPELGYVPGNVFIISLQANRLKSNSTLEQIENLLNYMRKNLNGSSL